MRSAFAGILVAVAVGVVSAAPVQLAGTALGHSGVSPRGGGCCVWDGALR